MFSHVEKNKRNSADVISSSDNETKVSTMGKHVLSLSFNQVSATMPVVPSLNEVKREQVRDAI